MGSEGVIIIGADCGRSHRTVLALQLHLPTLLSPVSAFGSLFFLHYLSRKIISGTLHLSDINNRWKAD